MAGDNTKDLTSKQVKRVPNPTGKGGFRDHPELRNDRGLIKTPTFWINHYGEKTPEEVLYALKEKPKSEKTMFEEIALAHLVGGRTNPSERKDLINRIDGMPQQKTDITSNGETINVTLDK